MGGGGWAPCDAPVAIEDGYVAAGGLDELGEAVGGAVGPPPAPQGALTIRGVAGDLGLPWDEDGDNSDPDVDMGPSPLVTKAVKGLGRAGKWRVGPMVEPVVLFYGVKGQG